MSAHYDVVVIGSGFSGSVAGLRLAEAGLSVAILERGRWWAPEEFPRRSRELWKVPRSRFNPAGLYDTRDLDGVTVYSANGVGGGSIVGSNVLARPQPAVFDAFPERLQLVDLEPGYARVLRELSAASVPDASAIPKASQLRRLAGHIPGSSWRPVDLSINFAGERKLPTVAGYPHSGRFQRACVGCADCNLGCHVLAKNTLDLNYLPAAMAAGARVVSRCLVERIAAGSDGSYRVAYRLGRRRHRGSVRAGMVILAAGAVGSTELLLRARRAGGLRHLSPRLGTGFSANGAHVAMGFGAAEATHGPTGPVVVSSLTCPDLGSGRWDILIEDATQARLLTGLAGRGLPWLQALSERLGRSLQRAGVRGLVGEMRALRGSLLPPPRDGRTVTLMVMGRDVADGCASLNRDGNLSIRWRGRGSAALYERINRLLEELGRAAHLRVRLAPIDPDERAYTGHPLGGCPVGESAATGAVSPDGEVFGHPGLYVIDSSIMPAALGVNPALTIAAQAEIMMARLVERVGYC